MQICGWSEGHLEDKPLLQTLALDISQLSFCRITKVNRPVVQPGHKLAKSALINFMCCPDNQP